MEHAARRLVGIRDRSGEADQQSRAKQPASGHAIALQKGSRLRITVSAANVTKPPNALLPQGLGEREAELERHRDALEPLRQRWKAADRSDHFGDPVVDVGVAGTATDLDQRDLAVVEDDELDD